MATSHNLAEEIKSKFSNSKTWEGWWELYMSAKGKLFYEELKGALSTLTRVDSKDVTLGLQSLLGMQVAGSSFETRRKQATWLSRNTLWDLDYTMNNIKIDGERDDEPQDRVQDKKKTTLQNHGLPASIIACSICRIYPDLPFDPEEPVFVRAASKGWTSVVAVMIDSLSNHLKNNAHSEVDADVLGKKLKVEYQGQNALCWAAEYSHHDVMRLILDADCSLAEHLKLPEKLLMVRGPPDDAKYCCVKVVLEKWPQFAHRLQSALDVDGRTVNLFLEAAQQRSEKIVTRDILFCAVEKGSEEIWDALDSKFSLWADDVRDQDGDLMQIAVEKRKIAAIRCLAQRLPGLTVKKSSKGGYPLQYLNNNEHLYANDSDAEDEERGGYFKPATNSFQSQVASNQDPTEQGIREEIRAAIVPAIIRAAESTLDAQRILLRCKAEAREISLHLADFNTAAYSFRDFTNSLIGATDTDKSLPVRDFKLEFENVLHYADFPELNSGLPKSWDELRTDQREVYDILMWLVEKKSVSEIFEIKVLDRLCNPHDHWMISRCVKRLRIASLNWRRLDLYLGNLDPHNSIRTLNLYTSGNPAVLEHWFGEKLMKLAERRLKGMEQAGGAIDGERFPQGQEESGNEEVSKNGHYDYDECLQEPCGLWNLGLETLIVHIVDDVLSDDRGQDLKRLLDGAIDLFSKKLSSRGRPAWILSTTKERWLPQRSSIRQPDLEKIGPPELKDFIDGYRNMHRKQQQKVDRGYKLPPPRNVKVAVIDNGVVLVGNNAKSSIGAQIRAGHSFVLKNGSVQPWWHATGPHGTQMTNLICSIDPCCEIFVARVGDSNTSGVTPRRLAMAIRWAVENHVDIISVSIALTYSDEGLEGAVRDAISSGIAVICSTNDELSAGEQAFPAKFSDTISVAACDKHGRMLNWSKEQEKSWRFNGKDILAGTVAFVASEERITGNSVATAIAAGLGSLILSCYYLTGRAKDPKLRKDLIVKRFGEMAQSEKLWYIEPKHIYLKKGPEQTFQAPSQQFDVERRIREIFSAAI